MRCGSKHESKTKSIRIRIGNPVVLDLLWGNELFEVKLIEALTFIAKNW